MPKFPRFTRSMFGGLLFSEEHSEPELLLEYTERENFEEPALYDWNAEKIYDQPNIVPLFRDTVLDPRD